MSFSSIAVGTATTAHILHLFQHFTTYICLDCCSNALSTSSNVVSPACCCQKKRKSKCSKTQRSKRERLFATADFVNSISDMLSIEQHCIEITWQAMQGLITDLPCISLQGAWLDQFDLSLMQCFELLVFFNQHYCILQMVNSLELSEKNIVNSFHFIIMSCISLQNNSKTSYNSFLFFCFPVHCFAINVAVRRKIMLV